MSGRFEIWNTVNHQEQKLQNSNNNRNKQTEAVIPLSSEVINI